MTTNSNRIMLALLAIALSLPMAANAKGGSTGGGPSGGGAQGPATAPGSMDQDRGRDTDRAKDQDRDFDRIKDQDRLKDRDYLYLGDKDRIRAHDQDRDGKIGRDEFDAWRGDSFASMDGDGNSLLSREEYFAARFGAGPYGSSNNTRSQTMQERALLRKTERFRVMDGDGDGVVTRAEFMKFGELHYLEADANDDGKLTFKELEQYNRGM